MGASQGAYLSNPRSYHPPIIIHQPSLSSFPPSIMSADLSTSTSRYNFASIFNATLESYKRKTKRDLTSHPLLPGLQSCDSPEAVLTVLREQIPAFDEFQDGDDRLTKWVAPTVNVLYAFSATVGQGVGLVRIGLFCRREFPLEHLISGIPTGKCNLCRDRRSPHGQYPSLVVCANYFGC